jgi:hypothetical protein
MIRWHNKPLVEYRRITAKQLISSCLQSEPHMRWHCSSHFAILSVYWWRGPSIIDSEMSLQQYKANYADFMENISIVKKHNVRTSTLFRSLTTVCRCLHCPCSARCVSPGAHVNVAHMNSSVCLQPLYAVCNNYKRVSYVNTDIQNVAPG